MARLIFCFAFVVSIAAVLGSPFGDDDVLERHRRANKKAKSKEGPMKISVLRITTTPPPLTCKDAPFKEYNKNCCKYVPGDFFKNTSMYACNNLKKDEALFKFTQEYLLQEQQDTSKGNKINWYQESVVKALGRPACFVNCLFTDLGLLKDDKKNVDDAKLATHLRTLVHADWIDAVLAANTYCKDYVTDAVFTPTTINNVAVKPAVNCNLLPLAWVQCIRFKIIGECKPALEPANPKPQCAIGTNAQDKCNTVFTTTVAPTRR